MNKIKIHQGKLKGKQDSIFYDGEIATLETERYIYRLIAVGEVELLIDGESYGNHGGASYKLEDAGLNDRKLKELENKGRIEWLYNNWFEVVLIDKKTGKEYYPDWVEYEYDKAIDLLKEVAKEEKKG